MDDTFQMSRPETPTTGDFLSFTILDGDLERPARITGTALALLGRSSARREVFLANLERIRQAAYLMSRKNPTVDVIILGAESF